MRPAWWDAQAAQLQAANRHSEAQKSEHYTEEEARRAAVYAREDLAMVVAQLSALNSQAAFLCRLGLILTVMAVIAFAKYMLAGIFS